jgi:hypothetical protein
MVRDPGGHSPDMMPVIITYGLALQRLINMMNKNNPIRSY